MKFDVLTYGRPELRRKAVPVKKVDAAVKRLARDMLDAMYRSHGLGLAAEQVGRTEAVCVIDVPRELDTKAEGGPPDNPTLTMPLVLVNPRIVDVRGEQGGQEGCLSFPEIFATIKRPEEVTVAYLDVGDGSQQAAVVRGLVARAVMHEVDHLNGVLLVDRMSAVQKLTFATRLKRLKRATREKQDAPAV